VKFFSDFKVSESDCVIEIKNGKMTGIALVIMQSKSLCFEAIKKLNKKLIDSRYITLSYANIKL